MTKFIIAKQLVGKKVISISGYNLGRFLDAEANSVTGKIGTIVVEPDIDSPIVKRLNSESSELRVPYEAVTSVADYIVVDTKKM